jgi:hypothetical protein
LCLGIFHSDARDSMIKEFHFGNATEMPNDLFDAADAPEHISVISDEHFSERMVAQQGIFTVCTQVYADHKHAIGRATPPTPTEAMSFRLVIPQALKPDFLCRLNRVNINARSLFPGIDGLGASLAEQVQLSQFSDIALLHRGLKLPPWPPVQ